jgi:DNA polymerase I
VLEVESGKVDEVSAAVRRHMAGAAALRVPLRVDIGTGANWDEAH